MMARALALSSHPLASVSSAPPSVAPAEIATTDRPDLSQGDFPRPADLQGLRRCFPGRWADFLRSHFRNHQHVAVFFGVDDRTARDWLSGRHGVNSAPVIFALRSIPGAVAELLEQAA
jgi:hypothetical protein